LVHYVEGSVVRAHQHAAGARHQPSQQDLKGITHPQDEALGIIRGGLSTKLHLRTDGRGRPLVILATPGQRHEVTQLQRLLDAGPVKRSGSDGRSGRRQPRQRPARLIADEGYSFGSARRLLRRRGITAVIPTKSDQRRQVQFDRAAYRGRN
jgi:transposase